MRSPWTGIKLYFILFALDVYVMFTSSPLFILSVIIDIVLLPIMLPVMALIYTRIEQAEYAARSLDSLDQLHPRVPDLFWNALAEIERA